MYQLFYTEFVKKYASEEALKEQEADPSSEESSMSDFSEDETKAMEIWPHQSTYYNLLLFCINIYTCYYANGFHLMPSV